jgi:ankyrin repeat protein
LHLAAYFGLKAIVKLLLEKGAAFDAAVEDGQTLLSNAAENGHEAVVTLLQDNTTITERRDYTRLLIAGISISPSTSYQG